MFEYICRCVPVVVRTGLPTLRASLIDAAVGAGWGEVAVGAGAVGADAVLGAVVVEGAEGPGELGRDVGIPGVTPARLPNVLRLAVVVMLLAFKPEKQNIY